VDHDADGAIAKRRAESGLLGALLGRERWGGERQIISCATCTWIRSKEKSGTFVSRFVVWGGGDKTGGGGFRLAYRPACPPRTDDQGSGELGLYFNFLKL